MKLKWILAAVVMTAIVGLSAFRGMDEGKKEKFRAMRKEVKTYIQANVTPIMMAQRKKLEPKISAEDNAKLTEIREQFYAMHSEMVAKKKALFKDRSDDQDFELTQAQKMALEDHWFEMKKLKMQAAGITANYMDDIRLLMDEVEDQKQKWHEDVKAIVQKHMGEIPRGQGPPHHRRRPGHDFDRDQDSEMDEPHHQDQHGRMHHRLGKMINPKYMDPVGFMLWDTDRPLPTHEWEEDEPKIEDIRFSPNPSKGSSKIEYSLSAKGPVKIELISQSGTVVQLVFEGINEAGKNHQMVDTTKLQSGIYLCRITTTEGVTTRPFSVE